jgi:hypothetical protein
MSDSIFNHPIKHVREIACFVDGSYWKDKHGKERAGCGLYYGEGDGRNHCIPVPRASNAIMPYDSLRAELYAALAFVHLCCFDSSCSLSTTLKVIYTDSIFAKHLLLECRYGANKFLCSSTPSTWARSNSCVLNKTFIWNEKMNAQTILKYADVLDSWWCYTRYRLLSHKSNKEQQQQLLWKQIPLSIRWIKAHTEDPRKKKMESDNEKNTCDNDINWHLWNGNHHADRLAKLGTQLYYTLDMIPMYINFPLFRSDPYFSTILLPLIEKQKLDYRSISSPHR